MVGWLHAAGKNHIGMQAKQPDTCQRNGQEDENRHHNTNNPISYSVYGLCHMSGSFPEQTVNFKSTATEQSCSIHKTLDAKDTAELPGYYTVLGRKNPDADRHFGIIPYLQAQ